MGKGAQEEKQPHEGDEGAENLLAGESSTKRIVAKSDGTPAPPDGGWGWVVVMAGFLCNMVLDGIGYSFGILLNPLMDHYNVGKGLMSLVSSSLGQIQVNVKAKSRSNSGQVNVKFRSNKIQGHSLG